MKVALLANQASIQPDFLHAADRLIQSGEKLAAIFSPQHGFSGHTQANMIEVSDSRDDSRGIPIYSLYGEVRRPTPQMLEGIDRVVVDLQDVGARGYTFIWTLLFLMEACGEAGIAVKVWDRPNPINGVDIEGPLLDPEFFSFVGMHEIPIRHGLTMGELAEMMRIEKGISVSLEVEPLQEWRREMFFAETKRPWVRPSPNLPTTYSTIVYPGMELFEGTNLSEGRGTTNPFEIFGAPFIDAQKLCREVEAAKLPGVRFCPTSFEPTFDKWQGEICHGAQIHVVDRKIYRPVATAVAILSATKKIWPEKFCFLDPPYEYETEKLPFDILAGSSELREQLEEETSLVQIQESWMPGVRRFEERRNEFLLYT